MGLFLVKSGTSYGGTSQVHAVPFVVDPGYGSRRLDSAVGCPNPGRAWRNWKSQNKN